MSRTIPLTQNQTALVDDEDYDWLMQWKWKVHNPHRDRKTTALYAIRNGPEINGHRCAIAMHRLILGLEHGDTRCGDHINHNTLDNRRDNLRIVTRRENNFNPTSVRGYKKVQHGNGYEAKIVLRKHPIYLGYFKTAFEAHLAYLVAKGRFHVIAGSESHDFMTVGSEG